MATIVLSAAGMALGGSLGGSVLGLSTAVVGRAAAAMLGRAAAFEGKRVGVILSGGNVDLASFAKLTAGAA